MNDLGVAVPSVMTEAASIMTSQQEYSVPSAVATVAFSHCDCDQNAHIKGNNLHDVAVISAGERRLREKKARDG
ncbi:hypothetical protein IscW_ISCW020228 [Ixodes scapularis]|uniref:Uncharacterized protein n=1 Tax=Ixodes scapularis TaxID=6945 RepID=B7Q1M2_IXOSC|nr:hypothetical protein IscW_ISCW020228 [Ixodes scapularis]|eukprot:XP_002409836.1 hypothetical protein IscW_ISCW020228 [Ixodes scapularis]